jgi:hypothetical protein
MVTASSLSLPGVIAATLSTGSIHTGGPSQLLATIQAALQSAGGTFARTAVAIADNASGLAGVAHSMQAQAMDQKELVARIAEVGRGTLETAAKIKQAQGAQLEALVELGSLVAFCAKRGRSSTRERESESPSSKDKASQEAKDKEFVEHIQREVWASKEAGKARERGDEKSAKAYDEIYEYSRDSAQSILDEKRK